MTTYRLVRGPCYTLHHPNTEDAAMTTADNDRVSRSFTINGDAMTLDGMKKQAEARGFTIMCDEGPPMGDNTAPSPMTYFAVSILF